jgi:NAD(P)-dependent dehydrogenase (short-subunit alcohol dehydrogenase family)
MTRTSIGRTSRSLTGRTVWVVGASTGIGAALAEELYARGAHVAVSARRAQALEEVSSGRMTVVEADVTDRGAVDAAAERVRRALGDIDIAVFNAGYWEQMTSAHGWDRDVFARHVDINLVGMSNGIGAVLPDMLKRGSGRIVGVASVAGYRGLAGAEAYGATKAAQINMLEALRAAVARKGVDVTTVCPGFVRTELTAGNDFPMPFMVEPEQAAHAICDGLERGRMEIVFPLPMALLMKAARFVPVRAWAALTGRAGTS